MPAVTRLRHQQGDDVALGEAEQRAVVAGGVREDGLHAGAAVLLQAGRHGAGPGQGPRFSFAQTEETRSAGFVYAVHSDGFLWGHGDTDTLCDR